MESTQTCEALAHEDKKAATVKKQAASKAAAGGLSGKASGAMKDRAGSRPTQGQVQDFLKASGGNGAAASAAKSRVDTAKTTSGSAVSEFLNNKGTGAAAAVLADALRAVRLPGRTPHLGG